MGSHLTTLSWPKVKFEKVGCLTRWSVEPVMLKATCLSFGVEYSEQLAVQNADNNVSMLLGEEPPSLQELLQC